jgi:hypothetical protein
MSDDPKMETDSSQISAKELARQKRAEDYKRHKEQQKKLRAGAKAEKEQEKALAKEERLAELKKLIRKGDELEG